MKKTICIVSSFLRGPFQKTVRKASLCTLSFLILSCVTASGRSAPIEHFIPTGKGVLFESSDYLAYLLLIRKTLIEPKTIAGRPILQVALLEGDIPEPESVLTLYDTAKDTDYGTTNEGGPYILEYRVPKEILWDGKNGGPMRFDHPVAFDTYQVDISPALAARMFRLWHDELAHTQIPAEGGRHLTPISMHYCFQLGEAPLTGATPWQNGSDRVYMFDRAAMYAGWWIKPNPRSEEFHQRFLRCLDQLERKSKHLTIP